MPQAITVSPSLDMTNFLDVPSLMQQGDTSKFFPGLLSNLEQLREKDFQRLNNSDRVYLDNGATTQQPESVMNKMHQQKIENLRGSNHSENSKEALDAQKMYLESKQKIKNFFNANNFHLAFTSGTTGSSNLLATRFLFEKEDLLLITDHEHNSQVLTPRNQAKKAGAEVKYIPFNLPDGTLNLNVLREIVSERKTGKILLMLVHVSNVTGIVNPVKKIKEEFGDRVLIYLDMAQSAGHIPIDLDDLDIDFAGVSSHKMYGPMGMGAFFSNKKSDKFLGNSVSGGAAVVLVSKEYTAYETSPERYEPGTQNIEGAIEWGYTIDYLKNLNMIAVEAHDRTLGEYFLKELKKIPQVEVYGPSNMDEKISVFTFNIGHSKTNYVEMSKKLNDLNISVREGCFCAHLLLPPLLNVPVETHNSKIEQLRNGADFKSLELEGAIRIAFSFYNTPLEAYKAIEAIRKISSELSK